MYLLSRFCALRAVLSESRVLAVAFAISPDKEALSDCKLSRDRPRVAYSLVKFAPLAQVGLAFVRAKSLDSGSLTLAAAL